MPQEDRRSHERINIVVPARLWLKEFYNTREIEFEGFAQTSDLAIGGAFIRSDYLLPIGFPINLELTLNENEILSCRGEIVHTTSGDDSHEPGMGVMFTEVDAENRERLLRHFVSDRVLAFYNERFLEEFPHLESRLSLSEVTLILNLWEDKDNRLATLRSKVSEPERQLRRKEEIQAAKGKRRRASRR